MMRKLVLPFSLRDKKCLVAELLGTIIFGSTATRLKLFYPLEMERAPLGISVLWKTTHALSLCLGPICLRSEDGPSSELYKASTKPLAPNSRLSGLHWNLPD